MVMASFFPLLEHSVAGRAQDQPPPFYVPTSEEKYKPKFEPQDKPQHNGQDINKGFSYYTSQGKIKINVKCTH